MCQLQRLEAKDNFSFLMGNDEPAEVSGKRLGRPKKVELRLYSQLLPHAGTVDPAVHDYWELPYPDGAKLLSPNVWICAVVCYLGFKYQICHKDQLSHQGCHHIFPLSLELKP
jgi:hypothetical protein